MNIIIFIKTQETMYSQRISITNIKTKKIDNLMPIEKSKGNPNIFAISTNLFGRPGNINLITMKPVKTKSRIVRSIFIKFGLKNFLTMLLIIILNFLVYKSVVFVRPLPN